MIKIKAWNASNSPAIACDTIVQHIYHSVYENPRLVRQFLRVVVRSVEILPLMHMVGDVRTLPNQNLCSP